MNLNLLLVIMAVVLICMVMDGYKKGMVKSLISLISLLITCVVLFLIGNGLSSYFDGKIFNVILTILLLAAIGLVHHLLNIVFFSAKMIVKLPIVHSLDKLLGIVVGFLVAIIRATHDKHGGLNILNFICKVYLTIWRGTPTMVQLLIMYYIILVSLNSKIAVAVIAFGLN